MTTLRVPDMVPTPEEDAQKLREALQGAPVSSPLAFLQGNGEEEKLLIRILGHRNATQRKQIREMYQQLYNENLIDRINSEIFGDFKDALIMWTYDPAERHAILAHKSLKKKFSVKRLQVIVEIACASSPYHLIAVRKAYCSLFDCSLEEDIVSIVPFALRKLLLGLVSSIRYDKELVDTELAKSEADVLHHVITSKRFDDDKVIHILSTRNFYQLRLTFECYRNKHANSIEQDIKNGGKGDMVSLLKMVILCIDHPEMHFAEVIRDSILGLGTDEKALSRVIVTRAEIDMKNVKEVYPHIYKCTVEDDVVGDTSGSYKDFLLTLTGDKY
ncbi:annexin D3 [Mangifera indica]|uniref:annexin D3 n=1 Tax=Mangifera indica TaxID=29780 RepID=UPI001CFC37AE|nr:annexin D3 [Mangifera indica]